MEVGRGEIEVDGVKDFVAVLQCILSTRLL